MQIAVLGATGEMGRAMVDEALARGHTVVALVRDPKKLTTPAQKAEKAEKAEVVVADVHRPATVLSGLAGVDAVVSGVGNTGGQTGTLLAGARTLATARERDPGLSVVWLGALGTGPSAPAAGPLIRTLLGLAMRRELPEKTAADRAVLDAGGTVFHVAMFGDGPVSQQRRTVPLAEVRPRLWPKAVSRATLAAAMLDEAEHPKHAGEVVVAYG